MTFRTLRSTALMALAALGLAAAESITLTDGRQYEGNVVTKDGVYTLSIGAKLFQFRSEDVQAFAGKVVTPVVTLSTDKGDLRVALFEDQAPNTVANLITLAEQGFYKGMTFHRIIPGFMAQGGCPHSKDGATGMPGTGGPGYTIADEIVPGLTHSGRGVLSMANSGKDTNGSQFFLCFAPAPHLDGKHTVFGKVVAGFAVLDALEAIGSDSGTPAAKVTFDIKVVAKRDHEYAVKKL